MKATPLPFSNQGEDQIFWYSSPNGEFKPKEAYHLANWDDNNKTGQTFKGEWVWKVQSVPKIKCFLWQCCHHSIPVQAILCKREMEYCVEARALKSSLRGEILAMKTTTQVFEDFRGSIGVADSEFTLASELAVPDDDLAGLEWVSHFVDDSISEFSFLYPAGKQKTEANEMDRFFNNMFNFVEPAKKKQKKKSAVQTGSGTQFQRRCSHCQVQKTPQWRTGPLGAKTLCNACGVRYKSGRLFPEYRPACSPTFSGEIHSNSHRKVLEMRKRKETVTEPESRLNQMVSSF
ncbi:gata transcription factor 5 [Quercus suber]|uniref:Gata transcription factor 5 n=1 Tax=Quercus suber TaxID=58331 RepID=A0AAW0KE22_QUESU